MSTAQQPGGPLSTLPTLVFVHGWGFDARVWNALRMRLDAWPQQVLDRGYFSDSSAEDALPDGPLALPDGPLVVVGHSFGFMRMLARLAPQVNHQPCAWVGINGFARFCAGDDFPRGVDPRVLRRMASRLQVDPETVVDAFRRRCGADPAGGTPCLRLLAHDLRIMQELDLRTQVRDLGAPLLLLAGADDPVVPAGMAVDALPGGIIWLPGGGHVLPLQAPDWCAARIVEFLEHHGLAPSSQARGHADRPTDPGGVRTSARPDDVSTRFGAAAGRYDRHAGVQRQIASRLVARITRLALPDRPRILEVGCGTGLLTRMLGEHFSEADWTITDLSPDMVAHARDRLRLGGVVRYRVMDGEHPLLDDGQTSFDLICSSMALQWFEDPARGLARLAGLLAPGGHLVVALPVHGTFAEWRRAHDVLGLRPRMICFPRPGALCLRENDLTGQVDVECIVDECGGAMAFLRGLKAIGATASRPGTRPLSASLLRRVCAEFDRAGARCSYWIAFGLWRRDDVPISTRAFA